MTPPATTKNTRITKKGHNDLFVLFVFSGFVFVVSFVVSEARVALVAFVVSGNRD